MSSRTEVLLYPILSATPPCSRSGSPPCRMSPACWPPSAVAEAPAVAAGRWAATGRRCWCCGGSATAPRLAQLACDHRIGRSTAYRYLYEGIEVLAAVAPRLRGALLAARVAGHSHVTVDGTLIRTDSCLAAGPTARADRSDRRVDLWWSGKHPTHGGNVEVIAAPDGWPLWTSGARPGRERDTTALHAHPEALPLLAEWTDEAHAALAALGNEGERAALTIPIKHRAGHRIQKGSLPKDCW